MRRNDTAPADDAGRWPNRGAGDRELRAADGCRDFAAQLGLVHQQHSTGGKQVLGKISKMGRRDIRRLLIIGAMGVVRSALRTGAPEGSWLQRMLARKPKMLVAIARANKMARSVWAMLAKGKDFRVPTVAAI
jgi:transposase